jgi:hypothetical protein
MLALRIDVLNEPAAREEAVPVPYRRKTIT